MTASLRSNFWLKIMAGVAILFGLLTILSGGKALFGDVEVRASVGDAVPFVLWFNFLAGFAYVATGVGLFLRRRWSVQLSITIFAATALVFAAFGVHVLTGGAYELRTVGAMALRTSVWALMSMAAFRWIMEVT